MKKAVIDLTGCKYLLELHERIRVALNFPEWYGKKLGRILGYDQSGL